MAAAVRPRPGPRRSPPSRPGVPRTATWTPSTCAPVDGRRPATAGFEPGARLTVPARVRHAPQTGHRGASAGGRAASWPARPASPNGRRRSIGRDVLRAWCDQLPAGAPVADIEAAGRPVPRSPTVRSLRWADPATAAIRRSRRPDHLSSVSTGQRWSTRELLDLEARTLATALARVGRGLRRRYRRRDLAASFRSHPTLSNEQARGRRAPLRVGQRRRCRHRARRDRQDVHRSTPPAKPGNAPATGSSAPRSPPGPPPSSKPPPESRRPPSTRSSQRSTGAPPPSTPHGASCVDEAGMVGTRKLARLLDHADAAGAKVVLVGDPRQLPEIDAGGLLAGLADRLPGVQLTENRRQRDAWERQALRHLRDGDIDTAIGSYRDHDRITLGDNAEDTRARLVADWWAARLAGDDVDHARRPPLRRRRPQPASPHPPRTHRPASTDPRCSSTASRSRPATRS